MAAAKQGAAEKALEKGEAGKGGENRAHKGRS
jgi:hypothetical protein